MTLRSGQVQVSNVQPQPIPVKQKDNFHAPTILISEKHLKRVYIILEGEPKEEKRKQNNTNSVSSLHDPIFQLYVGNSLPNITQKSQELQAFVFKKLIIGPDSHRTYFSQSAEVMFLQNINTSTSVQSNSPFHTEYPYFQSTAFRFSHFSDHMRQYTTNRQQA